MTVALVGQRIERVRALNGFKLTHRIPAEVNDFTEAFVARIAADQIDDDVNRIYDKLRQQFRYKRTELNVTIPADGTGSITTPDFEYSVAISLDTANPAQVIWRRQVAEIREPGHVLDDAFAAVFGTMFNTVELTPPQPVDLVELIDRVELFDREQIHVNYDRNATWCRIQMAGIAGEVNVTRQSLSLVQRGAQSPGHLLQSFLDFQTALIERFDVGLIAFGS